MTIGYGLIILVIAEVFRVGTRLDEEQSQTERVDVTIVNWACQRSTSVGRL